MSILATGSNAFVQTQVGPYHGNALENLWPATNQGSPSDGASHPAVFNEKGLAGRKNKLSIRNIHLPPAEVNRINALLDRADDILGQGLPGQHEGIRHSGHRNMGITLTASIPCQWHSHQGGVQAILKITL